MKKTIALAVLAGFAASTAFAQAPASEFDRGNARQAWQDPGLPAVLARCANAPEPFAIGGGQPASEDSSVPPAPDLPPPSAAIPGVIAAGQTWNVVWSWEGNNADGLIAGDGGTVLFANNDASNVFIYGQIADGDKCLTTSFANLSHNSLGFSFTTAVNKDRCAFLGETFGNTFADAASAAGDQNAFVF